MLPFLRNLIKSKQVLGPNDEDVFVFGNITIQSSGTTRVTTRYGDILPDDFIARALCFWGLFQAANIRVNLIEEPPLVQDFYHEMMAEIVDHWPDHGMEQVGDFLNSFPFFTSIVEEYLASAKAWTSGKEEKNRVKISTNAQRSILV